MQKLFTLISRGLAVFKRLSFRKKILVLFIIGAILLIAFSFIVSATKPPGYKTEKVTKSDITQVVTESGSISTNGKVDIFSPTTGLVTQIFVTNGQIVVENQKLFTVKSSATVQQKQSAYADYLQAKSLLESSKATQYSSQADMFVAWDAFYRLATEHYEKSDGVPDNEKRALPEFHISEKDWLAAEANFKNQQNFITKAQASVNSAWQLYQATQNAVVLATVEGTVSNMSVTTGTSVQANTALAQTSPVLSLGNFVTQEVVLQLNEDDIVKVSENQTAEINVDAIESKSFTGVVRRLDSIGRDVGGVIKYNVYIEITNPDSLLRPGMSADATITTKKVSDTVSVPNSAVKPYKGGKAVRVPGKKNGDIEYIPVMVGIRGEEKTQIISGLTEGQIIITSLSNEGAKKTSPLGL